MFRQWIVPAAAAAAVLIPAGEALAATPHMPTAVPHTAASAQHNSYETFGLERNLTDTWDGRPIFRLSPEAARSGEGVYFMVSDSSGDVLRGYLPFGLDPSDWREAVFAMPRGEVSVSIRFGDPDDASEAETVAGVRVVGDGR